jgi:UDP-perosamine 4-acetyltransferase
MSKDLILFGTGAHMKAVCQILEAEGVSVKGFCVDDVYYKESTLLSKPVYRYSEFIKAFEPSSVLMFAPMSPKNRCRTRKEVFERFKNLGYSFYTFIHPGAKIYTKPENIGENVYIGLYVGLHPDTVLSDNCYLGEAALIAHDTIIGKHSYIGARVTCAGGCRIGECVSIGLGVIIRTGTTIVAGSSLGLGVTIHRDILEPQTVIFSPLEEKWYSGKSKA